MLNLFKVLVASVALLPTDVLLSRESPREPLLSVPEESDPLVGLGTAVVEAEDVLDGGGSSGGSDGRSSESLVLSIETMRRDAADGSWKAIVIGPMSSVRFLLFRARDARRYEVADLCAATQLRKVNLDLAAFGSVWIGCTEKMVRKAGRQPIEN